MKLKLDLPIQSSFKKLKLSDAIYLIGSCFSDEIGKELILNKFRVLSNPFGTIFNPSSIFKILSGNIDPTNSVENNGVYYHWDAHSKVSSLDFQRIQKTIQEKITASEKFLEKSKWLIITFGTAWIYKQKSSKNIVANCHKVDTSEFYKELLDVKFIVDAFRDFKMHIIKTNPHINIILTVSPVRHTRDGLVENNRSKARLIEAVHDIVERFENVDYFPAYETMIDELRDYRFYATDLVHPSDQAVDYLWSRLAETYFSSETLSFIKEWQPIKTALNHKPFQPKSKAHQKFLKETLVKLEKLNEKIDLSVEIEEIKSQII
ncbi:MAG: GSCFA domain-containing protein [Bacteroidota bacterium]